MATNGLNRKKVNRAIVRQKNAFKRELESLENAKPTAQNQNVELAQKENVADFYNKLSPTQRKALEKEIELKKIRENYALYLKYVFPDYKITPFHALLCNICQTVVKKVENGEKVRLCISCPPQHGKSRTITETLPTWFLGRNPELRAILTAYNSEIAEKFGNKNRQLVKDFGKEIFGLDISDSQDNKTLWDLKGHNGGLYSAGILAGITSNTSQLTIVDDPYKNGEEANNPTIRERVYQTFVDSVLTRSNGKGNAVIVIHTRWHDDDLIGRLIKLGWAVINIPCICENENDRLLHRQVGQTLCPELGFDAEWAIQMQQALGKRKWNALYQGKPYVEGGNIIKREDLRFYDKNTMPNDFEEYVLSCDLSFGGLAKPNDPYCMTLWGRNGGNHYLLKIYNKKAGFKDTANAIRIICSEYPRLHKKIVEKKANGWATIEMLGQEVGGFIPYDPKNLSKEDRLNNVSPYFEGGNVYFPSEDVEPNIETFITQLLRFPNTEHDDFVDTISQYLLNYEYRYGGKVNTSSSLSLLSKAIRGF